MLAIVVGVIWLIGAVVRRGAKKLPAIIAGVGLAALFLGVIVVGVSETTSTTSQEEPEISDSVEPELAVADIPEPPPVPTVEVLPPGAKMLSGAVFTAMTAAEFEAYLRQEMGLSDEQIAEHMKTFPQEQATAIAWQSRFATPVPREWTVEDLADCDPKDRNDPDLMSDCEVALSLAQLDSMALYEADAEFRRYVDGLGSIDSAINGLMDDRALTSDEGAYLCEVNEQWEQVVKDAADYVGHLERDDTVGIEVEILRTRRFLAGIEESCGSGTQEMLTQQQASAGSDVPAGVLSGEVDESRWYAAADGCDTEAVDSWSLETWEKVALVYVGAAILIQTANTEWSVPPTDLRDYRDFLDGRGSFSPGDWDRLNTADERVYDTIDSATRTLSRGAILLDEFSNPNFPHGWLGPYRDLIPQLQDDVSPDGTLWGTLAVPQGEQADSVRDGLRVLRSMFLCRTAEMQGQ